MTHGRQGACTLHQFAARARISPRSPEVTSQVTSGHIADIAANRQRKHAPWMQFNDDGNSTESPLIQNASFPPPLPSPPRPSSIPHPTSQNSRGGIHINCVNTIVCVRVWRGRGEGGSLLLNCVKNSRGDRYINCVKTVVGGFPF